MKVDNCLINPTQAGAMAIADWPEDERPREKLLNFGAAYLSEAELLAIFLQTGVKGKSALDVARELLLKFDGLNNVLGATKNQLIQIPGVGDAKFSTLQAALELGRRCLAENLKQKTSLTTASEAKDYFIAKLGSYRHEVFSCLFLDSRHRFIQYKELFHGTLNCAPIYPRIIVEIALECNAGALIFAHNHPSGDIEPSRQDVNSTNEIKKILQCLDIEVMDHIVVAGNKGQSLAEQGLLIN